MSDEKILSKEEVEDLASTKENEDSISEDKDVGFENLMNADFLNQEKIIRGDYTVLDRIHERFKKNMIEKFYEIMSEEVKVEMKKMQVMKSSEFTEIFKSPSSAHMLRMHPLIGKTTIVLDNKLVNMVIESYFGGHGSGESEIEEREFTAIEIRIIEKILYVIVEELQAAWNPIFQLRIEILRKHVNLQLTTGTNNHDFMIVCQFDFDFNGNIGSFYVALPHSMLESIREQLDLGSARTSDEIDPNWLKNVTKELQEVELDIKSIFSEKTISLKELMNFKKGDFIKFEKGDGHIVYVEGMPFFSGSYGANNDYYAIKIDKKLK